MRTLFLALITFSIVMSSLQADEAGPNHYTSDFNTNSLNGLTLADPLGAAGVADPAVLHVNDAGQLVVTGHSNGTFPAGRSRAAAQPEGLVLEDFQIETDVISWERTGLFRNVMLMARVREVGFGTMDAYMVLYHTGERRLEIWRVTNELSFVNLSNSGTFEAPAEGFRFTFTGKEDNLTAQAFTLLGEELAITVTSDSTYTEGSVGIGIVGDGADMSATFDNFRIFDPNNVPEMQKTIEVSWIMHSENRLSIGLTGVNEGAEVAIADSEDLAVWSPHELRIVTDSKVEIPLDDTAQGRYYRVRKP